MPYAEGRTFLDADSHIMELPDFFTAHADPGDRARLPEVSFATGGRSAFGVDEAAERRAHPPESVAEMVALGDSLIAGPKGYHALGAFNTGERTQALDQLGFHRQLVFTTFAAPMAFEQNDISYAAARAHNRGMVEFCADDERLMGVAALPLDDPKLALAELDHIISDGLAAAWIPHRPAGGRSPGHDELDPIWARLAEAGIPFVLHVGGRPLQIHPDWMNTGRPHDVETFLGTMILDGVLERHPTLRGAAVELGAGWVPSFLKRLDWSANIWRKSEPELAKLNRTPSEQITTQLAFTPYPYEDVGDMIRSSSDELYLFSSDYPHLEGGRNPIGRFEASLDGLSAETYDRFYETNFRRIFGPA